MDEEQSPVPKRKRRPSMRQRGFTRKRTVAAKKITREKLRLEWLKLQVDGFDDSELEARPRVRGDCQGAAQRPCPWVGCKHHLYLDVNPKTGSITINFPDLEPWELQQTCSLDLATGNGITLEEVGEHMNITRERVRQIEVRALLKVKPIAEEADMREIEIGVHRSTPMGEIQDGPTAEYSPSQVSYVTL